MPSEFSPKSRSSPPVDLRTRLAWLTVTAGGLGAVPLMPGTFGTLGGVVIAALSGLLAPPFLQLPLLALALLLVCAANILLGDWCENYFRGKDPQNVVIDEVAGYLLTALLTWNLFPLANELAAVFVVFRVFDIVKPLPARLVERWPKGWGVLSDDLVAGLFSAGGLWLVALLLPWFGSQG